MVHYLFDAHALEVVGLASRENGRQDLVLLCRGEDEYGVGGRLFESLEEGVESRRAEHVHLVDNEHLVLPDLWRNAHLLDEVSDVVDRVV